MVCCQLCSSSYSYSLSISARNSLNPSSSWMNCSPFSFSVSTPMIPAARPMTAPRLDAVSSKQRMIQIICRSVTHLLGFYWIWHSRMPCLPTGFSPCRLSIFPKKNRHIRQLQISFFQANITQTFYGVWCLWNPILKLWNNLLRGILQADSVLEMLYDCHNERNPYDNDQIKADFNTLYQQMNGMPRISEFQCWWRVAEMATQHHWQRKSVY